jgi:GxxExxY protein
MNTDQSRYKYEELTEKIIGVFYAVYNELGYGFLESVYERCFVIALNSAGLVPEEQVAVPIFFRGVQVAQFAADLLVNKKILIEIKTCKTLERAHEAQLLNYLRGTEIEVGLLLNFGERPQVRRLIFDNERKKSRGLPEQASAASAE